MFFKSNKTCKTHRNIQAICDSFMVKEFDFIINVTVLQRM